MGVLGSVTGCQDQMQPNIFANRFIIITIFITILQMRKLRSAVESTTSKTFLFEDFPGGPVAKIPCPSAGGLGSIPGQGTSSHMPQPTILDASMKTEDPMCCN